MHLRGLTPCLIASILLTACGEDSVEGDWSYGRPTWSPDGRSIAFFERRGWGDIFIADANGANQRAVINRNWPIGARFWSPHDPAWAPDGKSIAFSAPPFGLGGTAFGFDIHTVPIEGQDRRNLTDNRDRHAFDPAWSPDGNRIAFTAHGVDTCGVHNIYVMDADGANKRNITPGRVWVNSPAWSPDGKSIAFSLGAPFTDSAIYLMDADGANQRRITHGPGRCATPAWSPTGRQIAFSSYLVATDTWEVNDPGIDVMDADGANRHRIIDGAGGWAQDPAWAPDGESIAFSSRGDIYVMAADGGRRRNITNPGYDEDTAP